MPNPIMPCAQCGATMPHACPSGTDQVGEPICCSCASRLRDDAQRPVDACSCSECFVEAGLTQDIWGDCTPYGPCPCTECRILRAECV